MTLDSIVNETVAFVRAHEAWAPLIVGLLAFGESFAVISLLIPATFALVGIGALIGASGIQFLPCWAAAAFGAALGDWISYWIGLKLKDTARHVWPLSRYPGMYERGEHFFLRWGVWSIFIGRFFGPVRAVIPLIAGTFSMPTAPFQLANITSAILWAFVLLAPGFAALRMFQW
jgi:membrane protein DedA with SNARE-associated domain